MEQIDTRHEGLEMFFKPWEAEIVYCALTQNIAFRTGGMHAYVNRQIAPKTISMASVSQFLKELKQRGILMDTGEVRVGGGTVYAGNTNVPDLFRSAWRNANKKINDALGDFLVQDKQGTLPYVPFRELKEK